MLSTLASVIRTNPLKPRIYSDRTAQATLHLYKLLASVHYAGLPPVSLRSLLTTIRGGESPTSYSLQLHPLLTGIGSGSVGEMAALAAITAAKQPLAILEFGTHEGCSTWHLFSNAPTSAQVTTLDLPPHCIVAGSTDKLLQGVTQRPYLPNSDRITVLEADSRTWVPSTSRSIDLCFIDGGHSYECVKNDTEKALTLMSDGGVILWHDAAWTTDGYEVNRYLRQLRAEGRDVRLVRVGPYDYCALAVLIV